MKRYLAIDIGASSGRHIVGWMEDGQVKTEEVYRFPNGVQSNDGHLCWDTEALFRWVVAGIRIAFSRFDGIRSLSIDTWGVDYVLMKGEKVVYPCYAYRDSRTECIIGQLHSKIDFSELYRLTGCQFQSFNSIYQLFCDKVQGRLEGVTDLMMIPEYLMYKLTGVKIREYTNATTTGMVNATTGEFDETIISRLELPAHLFPALQHPGTTVGKLKSEIAQAVGGNCNVVLCATHDTGSAVEGIPIEGNQPYISSGTWSLLGVKTVKPITDINSQRANFSNEGGVGYNRYQKNIMGMWLVNGLQKELCPDLCFSEIINAAQRSSCDLVVDANDPEFLAPESMKQAFDRASGWALKETGDYFRCAYRSVAASYRKALKELEHNTQQHYDKLYIVGGGARNAYLNDLTQVETGKDVIALPIEATALGNLKIQMEVG